MENRIYNDASLGDLSATVWHSWGVCFDSWCPCVTPRPAPTPARARLYPGDRPGQTRPDRHAAPPLHQPADDESRALAAAALTTSAPTRITWTHLKFTENAEESGHNDVHSVLNGFSSHVFGCWTWKTNKLITITECLYNICVYSKKYECCFSA